MKKMLAPFLFLFTDLNTMHMPHDVRLFSVTCVRFFFSLSTMLTHDNTHTNNTKGAPRTKPGSRWFWGLGGAHHFFDTSFVCRSHVLGASLRAQAPFLTCVVWQMRTKRAPCRARDTTGCGGVGAPAVGAGGVWERPTRPLGDALPFGCGGLACGQWPRISGGTFFIGNVDRSAFSRFSCVISM